MNEFIQNQESAELAAAKEKLKAIKDAEMEKKINGAKYDPHFDAISPDELTPTDLEIYTKFGEKNLTPEELDEYSKKFNLLLKGKGQAEARENSSYNFSAWLRNQLSRLENLRWYNPNYFYQHIRIKIISRIRDEQGRKGTGEHYDPDLCEVDSEKLTQADLDLYYEMTNTTLKQENFYAYRRNLSDMPPKERNINSIRLTAYVGNQMFSKWLEDKTNKK